jgi:hypothetical protein
MVDVRQRQEWYGEPYPIGDLFRLSKDRGAARIHAACHLVTHQL